MENIEKEILNEEIGLLEIDRKDKKLIHKDESNLASGSISELSFGMSNVLGLFRQNRSKFTGKSMEVKVNEEMKSNVSEENELFNKDQLNQKQISKLSFENISSDKLKAIGYDEVIDKVIKEIDVEQQKKRTQNKIVIFTDERTILDLSSFSNEVSVVTVYGLKLSNTMASIKTNSNFGKGTLFIILCGTHDLLTQDSLQDCQNSKYCSKAVKIFKPSPAASDVQYLVKEAIKLNAEILRSTDNDNAIFCGLIPVDINQENKFLHFNRECHLAHSVDQLPNEDPIVQQNYNKAVECFNTFINKYVEEIGLSPWNEDVFIFCGANLHQYKLIDNHFTLCQVEQDKIRKEIVMKCNEASQMLDLSSSAEVMNEKTKEKVSHKYDTTLAFGISNVLQTLRSSITTKMDIENQRKVEKKQLGCSIDNPNKNSVVAHNKQISIKAGKHHKKLPVNATKMKAQHQDNHQESGYDTTLAFGVSDILSTIRSSTTNKQDKLFESSIKERQHNYNYNENQRKVKKSNFEGTKEHSHKPLVLTHEYPVYKRCDFVTSSFNIFVNIQNISLNRDKKFSPACELERVGRNLELDLLKMIELLKNRTQNSIVLVTDDRDEFEYNFDREKDNIYVLKLPKMQLRNGFKLIQSHPRFGHGTIYIFFCGIHDLLTESIFNDCQLHSCLSPQTVFSLPLDTSDFSFLIRVAIDLEFSVLNSTSNDIVLFCGLIPVAIENYNKFISKCRPCFVSHPSVDLPKIDYVTFKNFLLTIECYNEFTKIHAQKLGFMPWDLQEPFLSSNSVSKKIERCFYVEKMSPNGYLIPKDDYISRKDKVKVLCKKLLSQEVSRKGISHQPLDPMPSTSSIDINKSIKIAAVEETLLNTIPFNMAQKSKKYSNNQLRKFDPVLVYDILVMKEIVCRRTVNNIVLLTDERDDLDISLNGFDSRISIFKSSGIQMTNAINIVKKHSCFGKGTIFIVCLGIHDFLNSVVLDDCVRQGCPLPQTVFMLSPNVIDDTFLIKSAMTLNFEILRSTANDIALFCGLIPVDIGKYNMHTCMNRPCLAIHPALNLPVLDNFVYKSFISAVESYNDFTKRHSQSLGFTPWDLEVPFFEYSHGSANRESNFIFQKMGINGFFLSPQENQNRLYAVNLLCQNLLPPLTSVVLHKEERSVALNSILDMPMAPCVNPAVQKYSDSQLENVKYIYQNDLNEIMTSMQGRTQNNIVIVSDERDNFDISLLGYDRRVWILKVPDMKFSCALSSIKKHPSFGMGTIFIFSIGTHDLLQSVPLQECCNFGCQNPTTVLRLPFTNNDNHNLIQQALQVNRHIIDSTKNDIVLFCGTLPVIINTYNKYMIDTRTCAASHLSGLVPPVDPILNNCYENSINWYNNFTKYHSQTLGYEPWDLEVPYFSKSRSVLDIDGFHLCDSAAIERAKEAKKLCSKLFQKLTADLTPVQSKSTAKISIWKPATTDSNVLAETDIASAQKNHISPIKSVIPHDSNKNRNISSDGGATPVLKTLAGYPGKSDAPAAKGTQVDSIPETSAIDCDVNSKYSKVVFIADKQYRPILEHFKNPNVILMADEHLQLNDLEDYIYTNMKNFPRKKTLFLIVTGFHTFSKAATANLCLLKSCKSPLQALAPVALDELCNSGKACEQKLLTIISSLKDNLPIESGIAILPPVPLQLISMNISHTVLHAGISLFPDYVIANAEFAVRKYYPMWMDSISALALSTFVKCNLRHSFFRRIITDHYKKLEMIENFETYSSNASIIWKKLVADILDIVLENKEQLDCPFNDDLHFDHLVFITSPSSLKLLPDITAYVRCSSFWLIEDVVKSRNIFIKIMELNKMAFKTVLFLIISNISMIAFEEQYPQCIVRNCEHKLTFSRLQASASESKTVERKLYKSLSSIKIIISEIKMLSNFTSKFILAPFTPRIYTLVSDTNDEKQHIEMHKCMKKKSYTSFLYGTLTSNWADLLLSFNIQWKRLSKEVLCKDGGSLNEFMNVINAKVANLTMITWSILSQSSFDDNHTAFSSWQSCILSIIDILLQHTSQGSSLSQSHSVMTQQQNLTMKKAVVSYDNSQNTASNKDTIMDNHITALSEKCSSSAITENVTQVSSSLGDWKDRDDQIKKLMTGEINHVEVIQGTKSVSRKEDSIAVVGNSCTKKALFEDNLPELPALGNVSKSATHEGIENISQSLQIFPGCKEVNFAESTMINKTSGSSSTSLKLTDYERIKSCLASEILYQNSKLSVQEVTDLKPDFLFQPSCSQTSSQSNTSLNFHMHDMEFDSGSMSQEQKASFKTFSPNIKINSPKPADFESLPIVPIISMGIEFYNSPAPRVYRPQHLIPIICKDDDIDEHDVISKTGSSNLNIPAKCSDSPELATDQSINKKSRFRSVSPNEGTCSIKRVRIKSEYVSPNTNKESRSASFTVKKEIISPERNVLSAKSITPERRTHIEKSFMEQFLSKNKCLITESNIPKLGVHIPKEASSGPYFVSPNTEPKASVSKTSKRLATEHMATGISVSNYNTLTLTAISSGSKKSEFASEHSAKSYSEIEKKKSRSRFATAKNISNKAIKLSDSNQNKKKLIPEAKTKKIKLSEEDKPRLRTRSSSKKCTHSSKKADDKSRFGSKQNQKKKSGTSFISSKKRSHSQGRTDSKSHFRSKDEKRKRSRSRSPSYHEESKSTSFHKKARSRSTTYNKIVKDPQKSKSKTYHKKSKRHKKSRSKSSSPTSKDNIFAESSLPPVKNSTINNDLSNQHLQASLRKQIGKKLFGKYTKVLAKMRCTFEAESLIYKTVPERHPDFKKIYDLFIAMNSAHGNVDMQHVEKLWRLFWESQYEDIKNEDWKGRQLQLIKDYEQKVPTKSSFLLSNSSASGNETSTFSLDKALILLETLCHKVSFMSPAVCAMVKICQDVGTSTKQAYDVINEPENHILINLVLEKFRNICSSGSDEDQYLYKMAIDWIPKLLEEAENAVKVNVDELPIDINAMARVAAGKDPKFMLDLIKTALQYEGISNPSVELVNEIVRKVCDIISNA